MSLRTTQATTTKRAPTDTSSRRQDSRAPCCSLDFSAGMPKSKAPHGLGVAIVQQNEHRAAPCSAGAEGDTTGISEGVDVGARTERSRHRHALSVASVCILRDGMRIPWKEPKSGTPQDRADAPRPPSRKTRPVNFSHPEDNRDSLPDGRSLVVRQPLNIHADVSQGAS